MATAPPSYLEAVVLGIVQGLTEFLPISSTAHLRILPPLFGWDDPGAAVSAVIQCGTLLAVFAALWPDIAGLAAGVFAGLPSPMAVGRYHSLAALRLPSSLRITARVGDVVMAVEHVSHKLVGVQFHPESILTPEGGRLLENVMRWGSAS